MLFVNQLKRVVRGIFPNQCAHIDRAVRRRQLKLRDTMVHDYIKRYGLTVQAGPFSGMRLAPEMVDATLLPQLVGSFERELHKPIMEMTGYRSIVNIGASYGYYSVGLARRLPEAQVHAFEIDELTRNVCMALAVVNGVQERITPHGKCDVHALSSLQGEQPCLVFCDCEGAEYEILQPDIAPLLKSADVIVELHMRNDPKEPEELLRRFEATHDIEEFRYSPRDPTDYQTLSIFPRRDHQLALDEFRWRGLRWAVLSARKRV